MLFRRSGLFGRSGTGRRGGRGAGPSGCADVAAFVQGFPGPAVVSDGSGRAMAANAAAFELRRVLEAGEVPDLVARIARVAELGEPVQESLELGRREIRALMQLSILPLPMADGAVRVLLLGRDATMERNLTSALVASRQMFKDLVECSTDFAWETGRDGRFGFVSPLGALGYRSDELEGMPAGEFCLDAEGAAVFATREPVERREVVLIARDGEQRICQVSARPVRDGSGAWSGARGVAQDVTDERRRIAELKAAHERLELLSRTDDLTGLLNRRAFLHELDLRLRGMRRHGRPGALIYIDLNNFKAVNDDRGHATGDAALQAFGRALQAQCRVGDLVARLGGDEFAVWLEETERPGAERKAQSLRRLGGDLQRRFGSSAAPLGVAIGIALRTAGDEESIEDLLARADADMYRDKGGYLRPTNGSTGSGSAA